MKAAIDPDQVQTIGPGGVLLLDGIVDRIDQSRKGDMEPSNAGGSNFFSFLLGGGISKQDVFRHIALHLPEIARMRLRNVDDIGRDPVLVRLVQLVERGNLPAKRRSRVTSKDKHHRLDPAERRERHRTRVVEERKREIRSKVAQLETSGSRPLPHGFEGEQEERRWPDMHHDLGERCGRLMHGIVEAANRAQ